jgi:hypothetical protein
MVKPERPLIVVLFHLAGIKRALSAEPASNTWRASVQRPPPWSTDFRFPYPLAIEYAPLPLTLWRSRSSFCSLPYVRDRRALPPVCERHAQAVLGLALLSTPSPFRSSSPATNPPAAIVLVTSD